MVFNRYIDTEALRNSGVATDIDNFRNRYYETNNDLVVIFPGFELTTVEKNLYQLYLNSEKVDFKPEWSMRPDYVSFDYYGTVIYWWIILYLNQIDSLEDFVDLKTIFIPSIRAIQTLVLDRISRTDFSQNEIINNESNRYFRRYPMDETEVDSIAAAERIVTAQTTATETCELVEKTETFTLDSTDITNMYVDLTYEPVNYSSITLKVNEYSSVQSYGYDYILKYETGTNNLIRISWSDTDCTLGNGMESLLELGDKLTITYIFTQVGCLPCGTDKDCVDGGIFT